MLESALDRFWDADGRMNTCKVIETISWYLLSTVITDGKRIKTIFLLQFDCGNSNFFNILLFCWKKNCVGFDCRSTRNDFSGGTFDPISLERVVITIFWLLISWVFWNRWCIVYKLKHFYLSKLVLNYMYVYFSISDKT